MLCISLYIKRFTLPWKSRYVTHCQYAVYKEGARTLQEHKKPLNNLLAAGYLPRRKG